MSKGVIVYDDEKLEEVVKRLGKLSNDADNIAGKLPQMFSSATSHNVMDKIVSDSVQDMTGMKDFFGITQSSFITHPKQMFSLDQDSATAANDIEIPSGFEENFAMELNQFRTFDLGKSDGESVNEGEQAKEFKDIDESVVAAEGIFDMTGAKAKEEKYDDASSIEGESILGNINNNQTQKQDYDDSTSVGNTKLKDINNNQTEAQDYDDSSNVQKQNLESVKDGQNEKQEYDASSIVQKQNLGSIKDGQNEKQEYDASSSISGQSILGSIDSNNKTAKNEIDDDAIIAGVREAEYFRDEKLKEDGLIEEEPKKVE